VHTVRLRTVVQPWSKSSAAYCSYASAGVALVFDSQQAAGGYPPAVTADLLLLSCSLTVQVLP
jgi:hypothetical protein